MKKNKQFIKGAGIFLLGILFTIGSIYIVAQMQIAHYKKTLEFCEAQYGEHNFIFIETTGKGDCKDYMGQCWTCEANTTKGDFS